VPTAEKRGGGTRHRWTVEFAAAAVVAIIVRTGVALYGQRSLLHTARTQLSHLNWGWLVLAIACECILMLAFALLRRRLLFAAEATRVPIAALLATAYRQTSSV
jgi:uncharacterized membrane protein YbhN (UPF0104 family)